MTKMMYSLSTGMPPIGRVGRAAVASPRCAAAASSPRSAPAARRAGARDDVLHRAQLAARLVAGPAPARGRPAGARPSARSSESCSSRPRRSRLSTVVSPRISCSSSSSRASRRWRSPARLLERRGLAHLGEHEQQDDRAEAAADAVEKRQAEDLERAAARAASWPVRSTASSASRGSRMRASRRRSIAIGSPSIGNSTMLTGTPRGSSSSARVEQRSRSRPETVLRPGGGALGRQAVREQDDVVGRRVHRLRRGEGVVQAGAARRAPSGAASRSPCRARRRPSRRSHTPCVPGDDRPGRRVEGVELELRVARQLRRQPVHRLHRLAPLARAHPRLRREQLAAARR